MKRSISIIYAYILVLIVPFYFETGEEVTFSYSVVSVGIFLLFAWLLERYWKIFWDADVCNKVMLFILSEAFLLAFILGKMLDTYGYLELAEWKKILSSLVGTPFLAMLLFHFSGMLEKRISFVNEDGKISRKENLIYILFLFICWGIVLLGVYPGFFVYDAVDEVNEVITRTFTTHHPLLHVLYLGGIVQAGYKIFGTYNFGIFFFTLFQMVLFMIGVIYAANRMCYFGFHRYIYRGMIVVMGLFPIYPMIALCSCKDSIFALFVLLWVVTTYEWFRKPGRYCKIKWVLCSVIMCLLRNNAIYAFLVLGVLALIFKKELRKIILALFILSIALTTFLSKGMTVLLNAESTAHQEMLTVPIQQLARTYQLSKETYTEGEIQKLYEYLPETYLDRYRPKLSDGVKLGFDNEAYEEDSAGFWKLWISIGKKAPLSYINAWLLTSYGYWYPDTVIDVYEGNNVYTFTYKDNSYFGFETEQPGNRESKIPIINEFYRKLSLEIYKEKLPVVSQLFSPGFIFWMIIFIMGYMVRTRGICSIIPYSFLVLVIATLLLGPTYLPRYMFFVWMTIPFMIGDMCNNVRQLAKSN